MTTMFHLASGCAMALLATAAAGENRALSGVVWEGTNNGQQVNLLAKIELCLGTPWACSRAKTNGAAAESGICSTCDSIPHVSISPCSTEMVCGSDNNTYASSCLALCQGVEIAHLRSCDDIEGECVQTSSSRQAGASDISGSRFTQSDLMQFPGFRLLGKVPRGMGDTSHRTNQSPVPTNNSESRNGRKPTFSVVRIDERGNKYVRAYTRMPQGTLAHAHSGGLQHNQSEMEGFMPLLDRQTQLELKVLDQSIRANARLQTGSFGNRRTLQGHDRGLHAIIGDDNRQPIDSSVYPYTAIGQLRYTEAGSGAAYLCTGTLFSERHVITNAHCVYNKELRRFHSDWEFSPGLAGDVQPFGTIKYAFYDVYTEAYVADFKNWDVAIITLQEPVGLQAGWMGIKALPPAGACSSQGVLLPSLHTVGYPVEDRVSDHAYADVCDLYVRNGCDHDASSHKCDTKVGNSGSPLFEAADVNRTKWLNWPGSMCSLLISASDLSEYGFSRWLTDDRVETLCQSKMLYVTAPMDDDQRDVNVRNGPVKPPSDQQPLSNQASLRQ